MNITRTVTRAAITAALAAALGGAATPMAAAETSRATAAEPGEGWKGEDGLSLDAADNERVDAYLEGAGRAERGISPQVRAAAWATGAEVIGFENRLKSPDSLKRKVATSLREQPGRNVDAVLATLSDAVRYTLRWRDEEYTTGVTNVSHLLAGWGNTSTKWSNTWGRGQGYKGLNTGWRAPRTGQLFEVQFHTPASKNAQEVTHKLYEEQRLPGTGPERKKELQAQQDAVFAAVPVPDGADRLTAPAAPARPEPVPMA
ncbi:MULTISPECIES: ATP nucleotide 3'-pyrophosphokinase [unclassified Streptomyces]|uniref:ATP nucleotide 3'-pyrophosphokinase n=1 Tax=unclassified Streptomyces TaxID=2593676 RepID=UPI00332ED02D